MKKAIIILLLIMISIVMTITCEKHKDPFSAANKIPEIQEFSFADDSLKFKKNEPFKIKLNYQDDENQKLTATFKFLSGHGDIFNSSFEEILKTDNIVVFNVPSQFGDNDRLNFIPDTIGKVEIELELSDKVKLSTHKAETFFFDNLRPVASFTYRLLSNVSPYELEVDAKASYDPDEGKIEWFYWWFDDGTPEIPTKANTYHHTYQKSGTYSVRLRVVDNDGGIDSTFKVVPTNNQPPLAILQVEPISGAAPITVHYTATNSIDPDGKIVAYRIDFDDGTSSLDSTGTHEYRTDKDYRVRLKVQDNLGQTDTTGVMVKIATPPMAILKVTPMEGAFPLDCLIDATDSYDPQGGTLDYRIYINNDLKYNGIDSVIHTFDAPEKYIVRLVVTSKRNSLTDEAQQSVNVINLNPKADFVWYPENPQPLGMVKYTSTSTDANLTDYIAYYKWTFPDGSVEGEDKESVNHTFSLDYKPYAVKLEIWDKYKGTKFAGYDSIIKIISQK